MSLLLLVFACSRPDPALVAQREAVEAWEAGKEALDQGETEAALARFREARAHRPDDGLLLVWEAKAHADAGDLDAAIGAAREGLALQPGMPEARYDLAAWLARAGRPKEAGPELHQALEAGARTPREAAADPDFAPHLDHAAFAFLPKTPLEAVLRVPEGAVFWGSQARITLSVRGATEVELSGPLSGPLHLVSGIVDVQGTPTEGSLEVDWTVVARGAGMATVGPLEVTSGERSTTVPAARFELVAPPDKADGTRRDEPLPLPTGLAGGATPPAARGGAGELVVIAGPAQKVEVRPEKGREQRFERRRDGRPSWILRRWVDLPAGEYAVSVSDPGRPVLEERVEVTAKEPPPG